MLTNNTFFTFSACALPGSLFCYVQAEECTVRMAKAKEGGKMVFPGGKTERCKAGVADRARG
jgi:hypothetical protein